MNRQSPTGAGPRNPISIAMLFHIITVSAIAATCARYMVVEGSEWPAGEAVVALLFSGAILGLIIGSMIAFQRPFHRWMFPVLGMLAGLIAAPLLLIPIQNFTHIMLISFGGCWLLICFGLLTSRLSYRGSRSEL